MDDCDPREPDRLCGRPAAVAAPRRAGARPRRRGWCLLCGGVRPPRRGARRLEAEAHSFALDWHASRLLFVSIAILLLCSGDAFLTLKLLSAGALEVNPVMALVVGGDAGWFAVCKTAMTGGGVVLLVAVARYRFMRRIRVELALYAVLGAYLALVVYEFWLMQKLGVPAVF